MFLYICAKGNKLLSLGSIVNQWINQLEDKGLRQVKRIPLGTRFT